MQESENPALSTWLNELGTEKLWGQVLIQRLDSGFALRHASDRNVPSESLRRLGLPEVRKLATFNSTGEFRPLSASPDLQTGWLLHCANRDELWRAIQQLYPGSIGDWWAARQVPVPVTNYREFTGRQSGMYRITQLLSDEEAADVTRAACAAQFCLKRRLWSIEVLAVDDLAAKSVIPCLEPCALLLELARKAARIAQEEKLPFELSKSDLESLLAALEKLASDSTADRAGEISSPTNPRRLQLLLEKLRRKVERSSESKEESL